MYVHIVLPCLHCTQKTFKAFILMYSNLIVGPGYLTLKHVSSARHQVTTELGDA